MKDWDKYIGAADSEADKEARIEERNKWLDENSKVYGPGSVVSYRETKSGDHIRSDGTLLSTRESRAKEDIPQWKKFEIGRLEDVDGHIVPGPNALQKDIDQYSANIAKTGRAKTMKPTKIMPDDPNYTPAEKAVNWAAETKHGPAHCDRWNKVAAAFGVDNGHEPMSSAEISKWWIVHGRNKRWSMAVEAIGNGHIIEDHEEGMKRYNSKLSMQGHYTVEEWVKRYYSDPIICKFEGYDELTIYDNVARCPNWWLEGPGEPTELWRLEDNGDMNLVRSLYPMKNDWSKEEEKAYQGALEQETQIVKLPKPDDWEHNQLMSKLFEEGPDSWVVDSVEKLPDWYWGLDLWPMNTDKIWGKIQIAPGHFVFWDGSGPRGRWSLDTEEMPLEKDVYDSAKPKDEDMITIETEEPIPNGILESLKTNDYDALAREAIKKLSDDEFEQLKWDMELNHV